MTDDIEMLLEALAATAAGFVLFDDGDQISRFDPGILKLLPELSPLLTVGTEYRLAKDGLQNADAKIQFREHVLSRGRLLTLHCKSEADDIDLPRADILSSEFLQNLLNAMPTPVYFKSSNGVYLGCNHAFEEFIKRSRDEIIGQTAYELADQDLADGYTESDHELLKNGGEQVFESHSILPDGTRREAVFRKALFDCGEQQQGIVGVVHDISERRRMEKSNRQFLAAIEAFSGGFVYWDAEDKLVICNEEYRSRHSLDDFEVRSDITFEALTRLELEKGLIAEAIGREEEWLATRLRKFRDPEGVFEIRRGDDRWIQISEERQADGGLLGIGIEISAHKRLEENLGRLANAIDQMTDMFILYDADDKMVLCNQKFREFNHDIAHLLEPGVTFETLTRAVLEVGRVPDAAGREDDWLAERIARHRNPQGAIVQPRANGVWHVSHEQRLDDGSTATIISDITETRRTEEALREADQRYHTMFDKAQVGLAWTSLETGKLIEANERWAEIFGYSSREESLREFSATDHYVDVEQRNYLAKQIKEVGFVRHQEIQMKRQDGTTFWANLDSVFDNQRNLTESVLTDITQRKMLENEVLQAKEDAELANMTKSRFLANMSHELRTPLNAIMGFSEMILQSSFGPLGDTRYEDYARHTYESGEMLLSLVNDILDLSKIEAGEAELFDQDVDVRRLIEQCITFVSVRAQDAGVRILAAPFDGIPDLMADERKLKQILLNLLTNAIKFSDRQGQIRVDWRFSEDIGFEIELSDDGIGIATKDIGKALSIFGQIEGEFARNNHGTGLGLPLAKSMMEMHGGRLEISSEIGVGTTVTIRFPTERVIR